MDTPVTKLIGTVANYVGDAHPYLRGCTVKVVSVVTRPEGDPDGGAVCTSDGNLAAVGGLEPDRDIIEVVPWLVDQQRWSFVSSDARLDDLTDLRRETP